MPFTLNRILIYAHDVDNLAQFYSTHFSLPLLETVPGEWAVLGGAGAELALHRAGPAWQDKEAPGHGSNAKIVFRVTEDLAALRQHLVDAGVSMREPKRFEGFPMLLCDGVDPEGNVFQLSRPD